MSNGIGYNDNAREYTKRNLNASRYLLRSQHKERAATKVGVLTRLKKALNFNNVLLLLMVGMVVFMVINAPTALDTMWEQQYNHKE